jgi:hypothetical protein
MEALKIEILNPKAKRILLDLADLNLINISKSSNSKVDFRKLVTRLRSKSTAIPSLAEITKEVEIVRSERYARKRK